LTEQEVHELYTRPAFNQSEREEFFSIDPSIEKVLSKTGKVEIKIISANEYEAHHAFDLLYNNTSNIKPRTLATDTHGVNNVNFAILNLFGYQFAPRYAKFKNVFHDLFDIDYGEELILKLRKPIQHLFN
jgi:hypothetical protein